MFLNPPAQGTSSGTCGVAGRSFKMFFQHLFSQFSRVCFKCNSSWKSVSFTTSSPPRRRNHSFPVSGRNIVGMSSTVWHQMYIFFVTYTVHSWYKSNVEMPGQRYSVGGVPQRQQWSHVSEPEKQSRHLRGHKRCGTSQLDMSRHEWSWSHSLFYMSEKERFVIHTTLLEIGTVRNAVPCWTGLRFLHF